MLGQQDPSDSRLHAQSSNTSITTRSAKKRDFDDLHHFDAQSQDSNNDNSFGQHQQPIQIKRGRGRPAHNYDESAVAAMLASVPDGSVQNPFIASPMRYKYFVVFMLMHPSCSPSPSTPGRIAVAPALGPGIALLTPSRPNTPRSNHANNTAAQGTPAGTPKTDKGLRHFSARVSAKVEQKGCTTYNEVFVYVY